MKRGSVYWINLEGVSPPEFGKVRPGLVVSNSEQNMELSTVVILPISTQPGEIWPLRMAIDLPGKKKSFVVIPGIRQVSKTRLEDLIVFVEDDSMDKISEALSLYLRD